MQLLCTYDIVALEHAYGPVARNLHSCRLTHACVGQVPNSRPTEIVRDKSLIFVPFITGLNTESKFNTCLNPFAPEVFRLEDSPICLALFPEHRSQFLRAGQSTVYGS